MKDMRNSPLMDKFFKMGDKVSNNDPTKKAKWDYYLLWVMFLAFFSVMIGNFWGFFSAETTFDKIAKIGWAFVMFVILYFQYGALKQSRLVVKNLSSLDLVNVEEKEDEGEDSFKEMLEGLNDEEFQEVLDSDERVIDINSMKGGNETQK